MKSIFKISSIIIYLLLPMVVNAECTDKHTSAECSQNNYYEGTCIWDDNDGCTERCPTSNDGTCINYDGCHDTGYIGCLPCDPSTYNNTTGANDCTSCSSSYSTGQIFDPAYANTYGLSTCPWICDSGYYRGGTNNDECKQCPENSTNCTSDGSSGLTAADIECDTNYQRFESDGVVTCKKCPDHSHYNPTTKSCECANGANGTFGINSSCACANNSNYNENNNKCECTKQGYPNATHDNNGVLICSSCADNAAYDVDDNECKCNVGYYGNGATHCEKCPLNSTTDGAGSTSISACKCNIGFYDTESGTDSVSCTACPSHSTTDVAGLTGISACKCDIGFYDTESGTDSVSCQKCPIGMTTVTLDSNGNPTNTTTNGATSIEHCAMPATSEFCFTNPNSTSRQLICTPLIPSGATKINGRTISTTTNSGN